jgi:CopG antitoxin of type II toxin-antitoxin system
MTQRKTKTKVNAKEKPRIPEFASRAEEAEFWDTHSMADYWDDLKPVRVRFVKKLSQGITIRFDPPTLDKLRGQPYQKGIGPTTLTRMWILEHLADK